MTGYKNTFRKRLIGIKENHVKVEAEMSRPKTAIRR